MEVLFASPWPSGVDRGCPCAPRGTTLARGEVRFLQVAGVARSGVVRHILRRFNPLIPSPAICSRIAAGDSVEGDEATSAIVDPGGADGEPGVANGDGGPGVANAEAGGFEEAGADADFFSAELLLARQCPKLTPRGLSLAHETTTRSKVRVKFILTHSCEFGEKFLLVGEDAELGSWNPADAVPLEWSEGHVWTVGTVLPAGKEVKFKFLLRELSGDVRWQPGPDRVIRTWGTASTIAAAYEWDVADALAIAEEQTATETEMEASPSPVIPGDNGEDAHEDPADISASESFEQQDPLRVETESGAEQTVDEVAQGGSDDGPREGENEAEAPANALEEQDAEKMLAWAGSVLDQDIQWGRQTLGKILSRLGFYQREST